MATTEPQNSGVGRWVIPVVVVITVGVVAGWVVLNGAGAGDDSSRDTPTFKVRRGPLTISVTESGTIKPLDQKILKSEVEGQTTIIYLIAEGTRVKAGDLLVQLDGSQLEDQKVDQQIRVQNAEAAFIRARENLEVVKSQGESDIADAKLKYQFAQEDQTQYVDGEFPQQLKEAESRITLANEELERAEDKFGWSKTLFDEKYISKTELKTDELAVSRAKLDHELAVTARDLLKDFTNKRKITELASNIDQTKMAFERVQRRAKADNIQSAADLSAKESEFRRQQDKLKKIEEQIVKTRITAPIDGMVVYSTSAKASWRGNAEPLDEGQSVRERQELIYLPTAEAMIAETQVHESSLDKIRLGLPVRITIDALPGRRFTGKVTKIAPLPDARSMWMNPDLKVYPTTINIDGDADGLRTGMSCQAEIVVDHYSDAIYVPVQAVLRVGGQPTVFVQQPDRLEPRTVKLGLDNNRMIHITDGLEEGETVVLNPPLAAASTGDQAPMGDQEIESLKTSSKTDTGAAKPAGSGAAPAPDAQPAAAPEAAAPGADATPAPGEGESGRRGGRGNLTPEQMRRRFENMTPEEREKMREQRRRRSGGQGDGNTEGRQP